MTVQIDPSWHNLLADEFEKPYFKEIKQSLVEKRAAWEQIFPPAWLIFNAFNTTPVEDVKIVVLWQDPYHGEGQAMWLSFSVPKWVKQPPSLKNIYKEIIAEMGWEAPDHGDLSARSRQWVFLLNAILTVTAHKPASHKKIWREQFTDAVIKKISDSREWVIFMLRWNFAKSKKVLIDPVKHHILEAPHPSPFSAYSWFFGCNHFKKANKLLKKMWHEPINWLQQW